MDSQTSRKIIVAGGMAAAVGIAVMTFALRSHAVPAVAQTSHPPAPRAQIPDAPAVDQKVGTSTELAASDSQITTDVRFEIAGDSLAKDVNIGVTTTHGVVVLTGSLPSQDAIDHVKDLAGKVKDVKSVDTSALILASL